MTNEELCALIQTDQEHKQENIEKLYLQNKDLIKWLCGKLSAATGYEHDDLSQEAYFPFVKAAETFQPELEYTFSNYAIAVMKRHLQRYINDTGSLIRKPSYKCELIYHYRSFIREYQIDHGTMPPDMLITQELGISLQQLEELKSDMFLSSIDSLERQIDEEGTLTLADTISDPSDSFESVERKIIQGELADKLWEAVKSLKHDQQTVIKEHYVNEKNYVDISRENGFSENRVHTLHKNAIRELRRRYKTKLQPYANIYGLGVSRTGVGYFRRTNTSSTEYAALKLMGEWYE